MTHAQVWREACAAVVDEDRSTMMGLALSIARRHGTTLREMRGRRYPKNIATARREFYERAAFELGKTDVQIADFLIRDDSTVRGVIRAARRRRAAA